MDTDQKKEKEMRHAPLSKACGKSIQDFNSKFYDVFFFFFNGANWKQKTSSSPVVWDKVDENETHTCAAHTPTVPTAAHWI